MTLDDEQIQFYREQGHLVAPALFDAATVRQMIEHYMKLRAEGPKPGDFGGTNDRPDDLTQKYPRMINMHQWDAKSRQWASNLDLLAAVQALINDKPVLHQTMMYFKPPGGRGQGLHQDQQYITIDPLIGAWLALDPADKDVGQMTVVSGSHRLGMLKVESADPLVSFTPVQATLPQGSTEMGVDMNPGDVLFFDGKLVHGSYPNITPDRWRRSFICHFVGQHATKFQPPQGTHVSHLKH